MQDSDISASKQHVEKVKSFFDTPEYLSNQAQIDIRKIITRKLLEDFSPTNILDLGCGNGSISTQFLTDSTRIVMVDLSEKMLSIAKAKIPPQWSANVQFIQSDLASLRPFPRFDLVLCIGVLAHLPSISKCIAAAASFLRTGGCCVLQITDHDYKVVNFLRFYSWLRKAGEGYKTNDTTLPLIISNCRENGLEYLQNINYAPLLPGMGVLPYATLFEYQKRSMQPAFKWMCSETMTLFQKNN